MGTHHPFPVAMVITKFNYPIDLFILLESSQVKHSDSPNEALFNLLIEHMEKLNNREIRLTDEDCRRFVWHVIGRERSGFSLPFSEDIVFEKDFSTR